MRVPAKLVRTLQSADHIVVASHINPEGDAIGSALALAIGLQQMGKCVQVVCHNGVPQRYAFLPNAPSVLPEPTFPPHLLVLVDCAELERADVPSFLRDDPPSVIVIDHHPKQSAGNPHRWVVWVEPTAAATGEMVAALLKRLKVPLTIEIATCLYAALVSDTGVFRFQNTTPATLRLAAVLLEHGVDPQEIAYRVMESRSFAATRLLARMLQSAQFEPEIGLCWSVLTRKDFAQTGTSEEDTENFVNFLGAVEGTKVAVLFREVDSHLVKVSLRARDGVNVAAIAQLFGGGGHPAAAGCRLRQPVRKAVPTLLNAVRSALNSKGTPKDLTGRG